MVNTAKGFWRNFRTGREMLDPYPAVMVREATSAFLRAAEGLVRAWDTFRAGKAPAAFRSEESAYTDASATLTEMHMVMEPPKELDGREMLAERDRLASLAAFPDQGLVTPVMGAVKHRAAQIEAYSRTGEGRDKLREEQRRQEQQDRHRIARQMEELDRAHRHRVDQRQRELDREWAEREDHARRNQHIRIVTARAAEDADVRAICEKRGIDMNRRPAQIAADPDWHGFRAAGYGTTEYLIELVRQDVAALDKARAEAERVARKAKPVPQPDPASKPEPNPAPRKLSSGPSGPGF